MAEVLVLVLNDAEKLEEILKTWVRLGVPGITALDSTGLRQAISKGAFRDDLPLFPTLEDLLEGTEEHSRTLFTVVPDGFAVESLVAATERVIGKLDAPHTGIMFAFPIRRAWGLERP